MDLGISGKTALVMGSSRGLGRAIAKELIAEGVNTAICARDRESLESTAKEIGATPFLVDMSLAGAAAKLVKDVTHKLAPIDILVVNTGGPAPSTFETTQDEDWQKGFQSLLLSSIDSIRECLPHMKKQQWGRIGFITSTAAKEPIANLIVSNTVRAGVHGLINSLSKEYAQHGITVNAVMPGYALTERITFMLKQRGVEAEDIAQTIPAKRIGDPKDIAALMTFLMSDKAGYITGQAIACDGGISHTI